MRTRFAKAGVDIDAPKLLRLVNGWIHDNIIREAEAAWKTEMMSKMGLTSEAKFWKTVNLDEVKVFANRLNATLDEYVIKVGDTKATVKAVYSRVASTPQKLRSIQKASAEFIAKACPWLARRCPS